MTHRPTRFVRQLAWIFVPLIVVMGCSVSVPTTPLAGTVSTTTATGRSPGVGVTGTATIQWTGCDDGFECAHLEVPLDHGESKGATIELALIRKPATGTNRIGSLLINPGGPGEPGTTFLRQFLASGNFPDKILDRFDIVSWDPRGTGQSAGISCLTDAELLEEDPLPYPPDATARAKVQEQGLAQQQRCLDRDAKVIPHVGTAATVQDLDAIRAALGDDKLTYVGFSYGTTIGLEYLRTFPGRVRSLVLDGIALPGGDPVTMAKTQMTSFETNVNLFLQDCRADPSCGFGGGDPKAALLALLSDLGTGTRLPASYSLPDEQGIAHRREGTVGYTEALTGIATAMYNESSWEMLRAGLADATRSDDPNGRILLMLRDLLRGRQLDGTWSHSVEANLAINCADQSERSTSFFGDTKRIDQWAKELPVFGRFGAVGLPGCYRWPKALQPLEALTKSDFVGSPKVVIVNAEHDPATPYENAKKAAALLPGSRLVTWEGDDHTSFGSGHACIDDAVVPYLVSGTMPPAGKRCSN